MVIADDLRLSIVQAETHLYSRLYVGKVLNYVLSSTSKYIVHSQVRVEHSIDGGTNKKGGDPKDHLVGCLQLTEELILPEKI